MNIVFFCQSCGARFEVSSALAGKKGRCKKCGQMMSIPQAEELASMVAIPALSMAAVGPGASDGKGAKVESRKAPGSDSLAWLATANSNVALAPLTAEGLPMIKSRKLNKSNSSSRIDDDLGDSKPYTIAKPLWTGHHNSAGSGPASGVKMLWRRELGIVQKIFRWLNETAYLVSVPFLMLVLFGAIVKSRPLALLGATAVVLLNLGRIVAGLVNVVVVPFREGISQGIMFLIPPLTFFYLSSHWNTLKKPTMRVVSPILTIAAVFVAFTFIPSLRQDGKAVSATNLKGQLQESAKALEGEIIGEVKKAKSLDVKALEQEAEKKIGEAAKEINSIGQPSGPGTP